MSAIKLHELISLGQIIWDIIQKQILSFFSLIDAKANGILGATATWNQKQKREYDENSSTW